MSASNCLLVAVSDSLVKRTCQQVNPTQEKAELRMEKGRGLAASDEPGTHGA